MSRQTVYRTVDVDGLPVFYREAGDSGAPAILLLHGLPSSSRMYQSLLDRLSDRYRLVAPDYPGFGHSAAPEPGDTRARKLASGSAPWLGSGSFAACW